MATQTQTMDFLIRRRSFNLGQKQEVELRLNFNNNSSDRSPMLSRRRSVSPLMSPMSGPYHGPMSSNSIFERNRQAPSFPQTEDEQLYLFHERILWNQERSLLPLAHDLSDWMSGILGVNICPANFTETLENGVVLCQLAKLIEQKAGEVLGAKVRPRIIGRVRPHARPGSFFARDNVAIFLNFCRDLGVHNNLKFETNDLVSHGDIRSVLICLMEVGRLSVKYGIDPPTLIAMEQEIIDSECKDDITTTGTGTDTNNTPMKMSNGTLVNSQSDNQEESQCGSRNSFGSEISNSDENKENPRDNETPLPHHHPDHHPVTMMKMNNNMQNIENIQKMTMLSSGLVTTKSTSELGVQTDLSDSVDSGLLADDDQNNHGGGEVDDYAEPNSELDVKINELTRMSGQTCQCVEETKRNFKLRKLSEGKYLINGRTVFLRLLKGIHVMVRIGGGWETLEEFLVRNDPCQNSRRSVRRPSYYQGMNPANSFGRPQSSPPVMMLATGLRPFSSSCSTPQRSRHSSGHSLNLI